ncbi:alpha/beta hydrolase [Chondromyces crocatus]|uniref:Alpha/beta hydrolase fold-3 domain-containing protein n=1 Tax=Chondromyces crocatus TaxID=52 RepID=A0A0K1EF80_CHOCO|nr:alpha/beta hydrolase [Chondromyces crocatus]AKT39509.1 uncharacterized protein CMC5_036560 [Chondromyces crocatus]
MAPGLLKDLRLELMRRTAHAILHAPPRVLRAFAGPERRSPEGYLLDLQTQALLRLNERLGVTLEDSNLPRARARMDHSTKILAPRIVPAPLQYERRIPVAGGTIAARIYIPEPLGKGLSPMIAFFHGGGFVLGSLDSHDGECQALAAKVQAIVVSIEYRLAPEHHFPSAVDDALAAFRWVAENATALGGDPARIAVAGDSAGGNLAAVISRETRGDAHKPVFQLLVYPATDMTRSHPSHRYFREGLLLTEESINFFLAHYLRSDEDQREPRASPLLASDHEGLPPAMILTAGFDSLRDEGDAYAAALKAAGVAVEHRCYETLVHGFFSMSGVVDVARDAFEFAVGGLRRGLAVQSGK